MGKQALKFLKILSLIVLFCGFLFIISRSIDPDLGWHLRVGEWIFQHRAVPDGDIYSNSLPGYRWVDHEWAYDVGIWWLQAHNLWWIAVLVFTLCVFVPFLLWVRRAKSLLDLWMILLAGMFMLRIIGVRTQMVSFLLFFLFFEVVSCRYDFVEKVPKLRLTSSFLLLPLLFAVWANIHAGFVLALGLLGVVIVFYAVWQKKVLLVDAGIFTASCLATLVNPYGWRVYELTYQALHSPETMKYIIEWQSVLAFPLFSSSIFIALMLLLLLQFWRQYPRHVFFVTVLLFALFLRSVRHGPLFFVAAIPVATLGIQLLFQKITAAREKAQLPFTLQELKKMQQIGILLVCTGLLGFGYVLMRFENPAYPEQAAAYLREYVRQGNPVTLFNAYGWGGYLVWHAPGVPVFIDGRMAQWEGANGSSPMRDYVAAIDSTQPDAWKRVFHRWHITAVLMNNMTPPPIESLGTVDRLRRKVRQNRITGGLYSFLVNDTPDPDFREILTHSGWNVLYEDQIAVLLVCKSGC